MTLAGWLRDVLRELGGPAQAPTVTGLFTLDTSEAESDSVVVEQAGRLNKAPCRDWEGIRKASFGAARS